MAKKHNKKRFELNRVFISALIVIVGLLLVPLFPALAQPSLDQSMTLYQASDAYNLPFLQQSKQLQAIKNLQSSKYGTSENYLARTRLLIKTELDQQRIIQPVSYSKSLQPNSGWSQKNQLILWQPDRNSPPTPISIPLKIEAGTSLEDYSNFQVNFTALPSLAICTPGLQITLGQGDNPQILRSANAGLLQETLALDSTLAPWTEKGIGYLLRRQLNLVEDERWYYAQNEQNVVIQRRLDQDISADEELELILAPGSTLDLLNLRVTVEPSGTSQLLLNEQLKPRTPLTDGRNGWKINLRQALRKAFPQEIADNTQQTGQNRFHLREIFIFIPGQAQAIAASQPLRRVALLGGAANLQFSLPISEAEIDSTRYRFSVDLDPLKKLPDTNIHQIQLWLTPPDKTVPCAIQLDQLRLTGTRERRLPLFTAPITESLQRWGGPFLEIPLNDEQIEAPSDVAYLDFAYSFTSGVEVAPGVLKSSQTPSALPNSKQAKTQQSENKATQYKHSQDLSNSAPDISSLVPILWSSQGATLFASRENLPSFSIENGQMALEGQGGELRLDWPMDTPIGPDSRLFFGMPSGVDRIERSELSIELGNGKKINSRFTPNQSLHLDIPSDRVRQISLRLTMKGFYYLTFREATLFTPVAQDFHQAYRLPQIKSVMLDPTPQIDSGKGLISKPGQVGGLLVSGSDPLHWRTPLNPAMALFRGIHLNYHLPYSDSNLCLLEIQVIGTRASRGFQVCPPSEEGYLFLPFAALTGGSPLDLGLVTALEWRLRPPLSNQMDKLGNTTSQGSFFSLRFIIEGFVEQSAEQQIAETAIFKLDNKPVFLAADPSSTKENSLLRQWRTLPDNIFRKFLDNQGLISDSDHPWFFVDRIVAEPKNPLPLEEWLALNDPPPSPPIPSRWPKIITMLGFLAVFGLGWYLGWWQRAWQQFVLIAARIRSKSVAIALRFCNWLTAGISWLANWRHPIILAISCAGLWQVGRWGLDDPRGLALTIAAALAGALAWQRWHQDEGHLSTQVTSLLGIGALGAIPWWLGYTQSSDDAVWALVLLASILYWQESKLATFLHWLHRNHQLTINLMRLAGWSGLTAFLYQRGFTNPLVNGENYYFTFGGMAAVLSLRALLLTVEPLIRRWASSLGELIYGGAGSLYFSAALLMLVATALVLALKGESLAEQLAIIVYYNLVVGTAKEVIAVRRQGINRDEPERAHY